MIKSIELGNVRIFEGEDWNFKLLPLTVFTGTNSAGKSTLLKTLLLLRQSQGIRESTGALQGKLRFVGSQVDLGNYNSFVSHNDDRLDIVIGITIQDAVPAGLIKAFKSPSVTIRGNDLTPYELKATFRFGSVDRTSMVEQQGVSLTKEDADELSSSMPQGLLKTADFQISVDGKPLTSWKVLSSASATDEKTRDYEIMMPKEWLSATPGFPMMDLGKPDPQGILRVPASLQGLLPDSMTIKWTGVSRTKAGKGNKTSARENITIQWALPPLMHGSLNDLNTALTDLHYLAPLRAPAKRFYITSLDINPAMDAAGDFLPYILRENEQPNVINLLPGEKDEAKEHPLSEALNSWLYYLRTGQRPSGTEEPKEIIVDKTKDVLIEFKLKSTVGDGLYALTDSGFGYSQILPIIVRGLLAPPSSVLIIEQPELHLNPSLQVRLADFFVSMVLSGKQVFIETHSEHIVNALRVLAAEDETGEVASKCGIFYIDMQSNRACVHDLSIQEDGTIADWPKGFFGEAINLTGRLLRAQKRFIGKKENK